MFPPSFFMIHDPSTRSKNNISDTSSRQKLIDPFFQIWKTNIESRRNDSTFIKTTIQLNDNLAWTMIIDFFKFSNVTLKHISIRF